MHMFNALQLQLWYCVFFEEVELQEGPGLSDSESDSGEERMETLVFEVKLIHLDHTPAVHIYNRSTATSTAQQTYVADKYLLFCRMWYNQNDFLAHLSYQAHGEMLTTIPWSTKETSHITRAPAEDRAVATDDEPSGGLFVVSPKQKAVV